MTWTTTHREAAGVGEDTDAAPYLDAIKDWQEEAQALGYRYHKNKRALEDCPPPPDVQDALYALFAIWSPHIHYHCRLALESHTHSTAADEPALQLDDLLQDAWTLFLRAMVPSTTRDEAMGRLRARLAEHVRTHLVLDDDPEQRDPVPSADYAAPGFNVPRLYDELRQEGRLSNRAEQLWDRAFTSHTVQLT